MGEMTPEAAAEILRDVDGYSEAITQRTIGLTNMVWGIAAPAIFLTYGTAAPWIERLELYWLYAVMWIPAVALGGATSSALWTHHAIAMHETDRPRDGLVRMGLYVGAFVAAAAIIVFGGRSIGIDWNVPTYMILANGVLAAVIGLQESRHAASCGPPTLGAAVGIMLGGVAVGLAGAGHEAASLLGAALVAAAYWGTGIYLFKRG